MWWFPLMMLISPALPFILFACIGLSEAAPRVNAYDALSIVRNHHDVPESALERLNRTARNRLPEEGRLGLFPFTGLTPAPTILSTGKTIHVAAAIATTVDPPTTDPTTPSMEVATPAAGEQPALLGRRMQGLVPPPAAVASPTSVAPLIKTSQTRVSEEPRGAGSVLPVIPDSENSQELLCNCSSEGVLDPDECDRVTGQCVCVSGYAGLQCEECDDGHFTNGSAPCLPCGCDSYGAVSPLCDSSGMCVCQTGVYGPKCDECHPGFFRFSSTGCQPCQCNNHTSYCHPQSGVCLDCIDGTQGQSCEECLPNFYHRQGDSVSDSCIPCPCPALTSTGSCHMDSSRRPACDQCAAGFVGALCERCADGLYRLAGGVCVPCDCGGNADPRSTPRLCHPETGRCLSCANNTAGTHCQLCASGYTGDARAHNCTQRAVRLPPTQEPTATPKTSSAAVTPSRPSPTSPPGDTQNPQTGAGAGGAPPRGGTAVSWTQFNVVVLAVIIALVVLLMGFVGGVYTYREYRNRKLNAPFWTIELKEDNISFSSYHDSIPHADPFGGYHDGALHADPAALQDDEPCVVAPNGQLALATAASMYKA